MRRGAIQFPTLLAALLPLTLLSILMAGIFLVITLDYNEHIDSRRERQLLQQLAAACESGLLSANADQLQGLAQNALTWVLAVSSARNCF